MLANAHRTTSPLSPTITIAVGGPTDPPELSINVPLVGFIGKILSAAVFYRRYRGKRIPLGLNEPKVHPGRGLDSAEGMAETFIGITRATQAVANSAAFYRGETKCKPKTLLSVQVSPKANKDLPDLNRLLSPRPQNLSPVAYVEGMANLLEASRAFFKAIDKCAHTDHLHALTMIAEDKFLVLCHTFTCWYWLSPNEKERELLTERLKHHFYLLGDRMEELAAGFAEYEEELAQQPLRTGEPKVIRQAESEGRKNLKLGKSVIRFCCDLWEEERSHPEHYPNCKGRKVSKADVYGSHKQLLEKKSVEKYDDFVKVIDNGRKMMK